MLYSSDHGTFELIDCDRDPSIVAQITTIGLFGDQNIVPHEEARDKRCCFLGVGADGLSMSNRRRRQQFNNSKLRETKDGAW
jgi:hypothetical protein